jgi:HAE1 family hydrophobic/amphiphilic exporter-1
MPTAWRFTRFITAVREAIVRQNANVPGGNVISRCANNRCAPWAADGRAGIQRPVITTRNGSPIRIRDIGWAEDGTKEQRSLARLNGRPSVTLEIRRQSDANAVAVTEAIKAKLPQVAAQLPPDVKFEVIEDQSRYIYEALHEINTHLIIGSILASLVVFGFMRSWRATLIAAVAIPASVISTFGMMWALNFTLNSVTMLALVLMVGIVIDDATVVLENIFRWVEEKKMNSFEAARAATKEIGTAVLATTLSLVVILCPSRSCRASRAVPVSVRSHRGGGRAGKPAGLLHPSRRAHDERAAVQFPAPSADIRGRSQRSGFTRGSTGLTSAILGLASATARRCIGSKLLVMLSSFPLYRMVRQEFTPDTPTKAIRDWPHRARGNQPHGHGRRAAAHRTGAALLPQSPRHRLHWRRADGWRQLRPRLHRIPPHHERRFTFCRLLSLTPWKVRRQLYPARCGQQVRQRLKKFGDIRASVRPEPPRSASAGRTLKFLIFSGPTWNPLAQMPNNSAGRRQTLAWWTPTPLLKLDKPNCVEIDRAAPRRSASPRTTSPRRCASWWAAMTAFPVSAIRR